jgi:trehalose 6-phosphate phosphatase
MASFDTGPMTPEAAFRLVVERAPKCAFFFDFDGTLAPIQDNPDTVQPVPGVMEALAALRERTAKVAIVSARPVEFLRSRFADLPQITLFGTYGLEVQRDGGPIETDKTALPYLDTMAALAARAEAELPAGVYVEAKRITVSLHYRTAPELRETVDRWGADRAAELGLRPQPGRMVFELKPPGRRDKGSVLLEETEGLACGWYFGDDVADLKAFAGLDTREAMDPGFVGVRVAVANPETGHDLVAAANLHVDSPADVPALLRQLLSTFDT